MIGPSTAFVERLGMVVGIALVAMMMFTTVAPFFIAVPQASIRLIDQQQTILQSVFMVLVGYLWGNSAGNRQKDSTIDTLARAGVGGSVDTLSIPPGGAATVTATDGGAEIKPEP